MERKDLQEGMDLYTTIDYRNNSQINTFVKAGSNAILFTLIIIGFFISGQTLPILGHGDTSIYQLIFTILEIIFYLYTHDLIHFIFSKFLKIKLNIKFGFLGMPYITYSDDIESKKKYYILLLAPMILWLIILIPVQIIIGILFSNWFWLPFILIILNFFVSVDDIAFIIYTAKYKKSLLQINDSVINIYFDASLFKGLRDKERAKYEEYVYKRERKKKIKEQFKNASKIGKEKYLNEINEKAKNTNSKTDIDDLEKLDS